MSYIILLAAAAMIFFGLIDFFLKKVVIKGGNANVIYCYSLLIAAAPFGLLNFIQSEPAPIEFRLLGYSLTIGILAFAAMVSLFLALKIGEASIVVPLTRMSFVITAVCAFIFIGEKLTITKGLGILFAIAAILLLSKK